MRIVFIAILVLLKAASLSAQSNTELLVLDNYKIPVNQKGALIGKVITPYKGKSSLEKDSANLFFIDKQGNIRLQKGKELTNDSPLRYEITVRTNKESKALELVKDDFVKNKVIAHRGAWKHHEASENSLKALAKAIEIGCEASEFDVWLSSDNVVILSHDPVIGGKKVEETAAEELFAIGLKGGENLPSLLQYLELIKAQNKTRLVLEVKTSQKSKERSMAVADSSVQMVHRMKAQAWVDYITFSYDAAQRIRELDPTAHILYLEVGNSLEKLKADKMTGIDYHLSHFKKNPELARQAREKGLVTNVWTVNAREDMVTLLEQHVDYITTDEP